MESAGGSAGIRDLFVVKANRKGFFICVMLMFFQQFSGINAVIFFAQSIFKAAGTSWPPPICTLIVGIVQVLMTFASAALVERAGRRVLLIFSSSMMCLCLALLGAYFYMLEGGKDVSNIGFIPLVSLISFIVCFRYFEKLFCHTRNRLRLNWNEHFDIDDCFFFFFEIVFLNK